MTLGSLSDLQISLLAAGVLSVLGVWIYNLWQERKHRQLAQSVFRSQQTDVLMGTAPRLEEDRVDIPLGQTDELAANVCLAPDERIEPIIGESAESTGEIPPLNALNMTAQMDEALLLAEAPQAAVVVENSDLSLTNMALSASAIPAESVSAALSLPEISAAPPISEELADPLLDCLIELTAQQALTGHALLAAQRRQLGLLASRVRWFGYDATTEQVGGTAWRVLKDYEGQHYHHVCAALQLVDRSGVISTADLTQFMEALRQISESLNLQMSHPPGHELLAHAQQLDEFCAAVDWRLCVNIVRRDGQAMLLSSVIDLAERADLQRNEDGRYHALDHHNNTLFALSNLGGLALFGQQGVEFQSSPMLAGVSLTLDVPRVADGCAVYERMLRLAQEMVIAFDGALVDEQRKVLSEAVLTAIRQKIIEFQQQMTERHIPAGSRRALRLYS